MSDVRRYLSHISRPLLDRIDLCVEAGEPTYEQISSGLSEESSETIRKRVENAVLRQQDRYRGTAIRCNADLKGVQVAKYCQAASGGEELLKELYIKMHLTGRAYTRILKVARTIADLSGSEKIEEIHVAEAGGYRMPGEKYWGGGLL